MKNGMYGEMPKVKLGKFTISQMSDKEGEEHLWIEDTESGEGGEFDGKAIEKGFTKLYNKHF
jgi:hypothetical protein